MSTQQIPDWLAQVAFDAQGLIPAIAQDAASGRILMFAWMNEESLRETVDTGVAVYWSRSRAKLWRKGESSGHTQHVREIRLDCDNDVILLQVEQIGDIACHTGRESCFYQRLEGQGDNASWIITDPVLKNPDDIYHS